MDSNEKLKIFRFIDNTNKSDGYRKYAAKTNINLLTDFYHMLLCFL